MKNLILTCFWLFVIYKNVKSIVEMEIDSYRNANKFDNEDYEKGIKQFYQWSLKYKQ